ncbi:MAG TPA: anhydro-N-acetylmuramic acid kinase [Bacteroidia bacterium]|nr:anhydro-N-acetylmuramic acid kinase [Bacteroidia bacterium]HRS59418.1 anhydro-N-acetylmuramic acid kinase [Bacteroidia bacterium]HRU68502.1 anhydro-N-acetylmuramic acid kinase [Bacteroidia bacterium]
MMNQGENEYIVIGLMSGTSLDGLDLALCRFKFDKYWSFRILRAKTIPYSESWKENLRHAHQLIGQELLRLDRQYGIYLGEQAKSFLSGEKVDFIASSGHTVFHQPEKGFTFQLGHGSSLSAASGCMVINDFRTMDVALGGQGAPLVPIGDELLFQEFDFCLNLGGFANISFRDMNKRVAFDICPVNFILNQINPPYDEDGRNGKKGKVDCFLLEKLNDLQYYQQTFPKSLGREWIEKEFLPLLNGVNIHRYDLLRTLYEHIAWQISSVISSGDNKKVLVSGGGAYNKFLMELISQKTKAEIVIPSPEIIEFKEALIFAFLGVLRVRNEINCLSSVTGAMRDSCGGTIWL